jgi:periplasmic protein TonB
MMHSIIKNIFYGSLLLIFFLVYPGCGSSKEPLQDYNFVMDFSDEEARILADGMPYPIGGIEAITSKLKYPTIEKMNGVEGTVYVSTFINYHGGVDKVSIFRGVSPGLDQAAMDAIKATRFIPGRVKGVPVKVQVRLPVKFKLN